MIQVHLISRSTLHWIEETFNAAFFSGRTYTQGTHLAILADSHCVVGTNIWWREERNLYRRVKWLNDPSTC